MRIRAVTIPMFVVLLVALTTGSGYPGPEPARSPLSQKQFARPELSFTTASVPLAEVRDRLPNARAWQAFLQRHPAAIIHIDPRSGSASGIAASTPMIPGHGKGNQLTRESLSAKLGIPVTEVTPEIVGLAARAAVVDRHEVLGIDLAQLGPAAVNKVSDSLWRVSFPQEVDGIPVRFGRLGVDVIEGNLAHMGTSAWGDVKVSTRPRIDADAALAAGFAHAGGRMPQDIVIKEPSLEIIPGSAPGRSSAYRRGESIGGGYAHHLAWVFTFARPDETGAWEVMVDAHTGEVLAFDTTEYESQEKIVGGVYPLTNTGNCSIPEHCGVMQSGTPMPWTDVHQPYPNLFTNSAGIFEYSGGSVLTSFSGLYVDIAEDCGTTTVTGSGSIDLDGAAHGCGFSSMPGNTAAARTTFYHMNKIAEIGRGWLPNLEFLSFGTQPVLTNDIQPMNPCRASYNPATGLIQLTRSNSACPSLGEIPTIGNHEWGHALDNFDDDADLDRPMSDSSEAYADIAAALSTRTSCVGYGQRITSSASNNQNCGLTLDGTGYNSDLRGLIQNPNLIGPPHCHLDCSGARDVDWTRHADGVPDTPLGFVCTSCVVPGTISLTTAGPCGRELHCDSAPASQAAWDLAAMDLQTFFPYDSGTAFNIATRLFFRGSGDVDRWYNCDCDVALSNGCGEGTAFMEWLTADDDDGVLENGTPHIEAIYSAFNRHGIACGDYNLPNSGCLSPPSPYSQYPPYLSASPACGGANLSWSAVQDAATYQVFRSEGVTGCDMGRALIASPTDTSHTDTEVLPGRAYAYSVGAVGANDSCFGASSSCVVVTPYPPGSSADSDGDTVPDCGDPDDDNDGEPDTADCAPLNPAIHHGAFEMCNGIDDNCVSGVDEGYPDFDGDGIKDCVDYDADGDGVNFPADCDDLNPAIPAPEDILHLSACNDFIDNDCDRVIDLDCATNASTYLPLVGTQVSGSLSSIAATSSPNNVYQTLTEGGAATGKRLKVLYTFPGVNNLNYILAFEGFKNNTSEIFSISYANSAACGTDEIYNSTLMSVSKIGSDANTLQTTGVGTVTNNRPLLCIKVEDAGPDSQPDTVSIDRLFLKPADTVNCGDADLDGYTTACSGCFNRYCPILDCDDADAAASPGLTEGPPGTASCADGKDNDCDGLVDLDDREQCLVAPPDALATGEIAGTGTVTGTYTLTQASDDAWQSLKEAKVSGKSKLVHTWFFDNVPSGFAHKLHIEAQKLDAGDDDFIFYYSTDNVAYTQITGGTVTQAFVDQVLQPTFGLGSLGGRIYIQVRDSDPNNSGSQLNTVKVDRLAIKTVP